MEEDKEDLEDDKKTSEKTKKKKKNKRSNKTNHHQRFAADFGNYRDYYERRSDDLRLQALCEADFRGKSVVDLGCNEGVFAVAVWARFGPHSLCGLELDAVLAAAARKLAQAW